MNLFLIWLMPFVYIIVATFVAECCENEKKNNVASLWLTDKTGVFCQTARVSGITPQRIAVNYQQLPAISFWSTVSTGLNEFTRRSQHKCKLTCMLFTGVSAHAICNSFIRFPRIQQLKKEKIHLKGSLGCKCS